MSQPLSPLSEAAQNIGTPNDYGSTDETSYSAFPAVSITDLTRFARLGKSTSKRSKASSTKNPRKTLYNENDTPRQDAMKTPATARQRIFNDGFPSRSPSPTLRGPTAAPAKETTNLILDFTDQFNALSSSNRFVSSSRTRRPEASNSQSQAELIDFAAEKSMSSARRMSPVKGRYQTHLLDFDIELEPTPQPAATISIGELESLKSAHMAEIAALKASLSGKEAELKSLQAVNADAERRADEAAKQVREERRLKKALEAEKADWIKRGTKMEQKLKKMQGEMSRCERVRADLEAQLEESESRREAADTRVKETAMWVSEYERRTEQAEMRANQAELQLTTMTHTSSWTGNGSDAAVSNTGEVTINHPFVKAILHQATHELHTRYQVKHHEKLAKLKANFEKQCTAIVDDLELTIREASEQNDELANEHERLKKEHEKVHGALKSKHHELTSIKLETSKLVEATEEMVASMRA